MGLVTSLALACSAGALDDQARYAAMPRIVLEPGTAFCEDATAEGCQFTNITVWAVAPDGRVALGTGFGEVVQFDSTGRFVRRVGRTGEGPGEYRSVMAATYDSLSSLTLFDIRRLRLVRFDSGGAALGSSPVGYPPGGQEAAFSGDRLVFFRLPGADAPGDSVTAHFLGVEPDGEPALLLGAAPARAVGTGDGSMWPVPPPFTAWPRWSIARDGAIYFADGRSLTIIRADGSAPRTFAALAIEPPAVTSAELDSARDARRGVSSGPARLQPAVRQALEASLANPEERHAMITALVAGDSSVWAREGRGTSTDSIRWNGFDPAGNPMGYLMLHVRARVLTERNGRLLIVTHDDDDVPMARWYGMRRPGETRARSGG